jgi:hypothetical protein
VFGYRVGSSIVVGIIKSLVGCKKSLNPKIKYKIQYKMQSKRNQGFRHFGGEGGQDEPRKSFLKDKFKRKDADVRSIFFNCR